MIRTCALFCALVLLAPCQFSSAGLVLTTTTSADTYNVGDVGTVEVSIHSDNSPNDLLDSYLISLNLRGGSGVTFVTPQDEAYLNHASYVFEGRSINIALGLPATIVTDVGATLSAADVSYDFGSVPEGDPLARLIPDSNNSLLLGRFSFRVGAAGSYWVEIDPSSSFSDSAFKTFNYSTSSASFSAVPEPSGVALLVVGLGAVVFRRRRVPVKVGGL